MRSLTRLFSGRQHRPRTACLLLLAAGLLLAGPASATRDISPKRECSICHIMWLNEFQQEQAQPLIPYEPKPVVASGRQDVVSTERMCFSCHDGFVRDSRFAWAKREHFHPVGVKPPPHIKIPKAGGKDLFPLNDDGNIYCGTCHSAHGVDWKEEFSPLFLRAKNIDSSLCLACHLDHSTGPGEGNHPLYKPLQNQPPALLEAGAKFGRQSDVICQSCHRVHGAGDEKLLMLENESSQLCGSCHDDRNTHDHLQAARAGTHPVNVQPRGLSIPASLTAAGAKLGPEGEVICQTCHRPHSAEAGRNILVSDNRDAALCKGCHERQRSVDNSKHRLPDGPIPAKDRERGSCMQCHLPHKGQGPKMWARALPPESEPMAGLCLSCHAEEAMAAKHPIGRHSHPTGKPLAGLAQATDLPGFSPEGLRQDGAGNVSCASCHDPHRWDPEDPQAVADSQTPGNGDNRFLRVRNDTEASLCRNCHDEQFAIADSPHDKAVILKQDAALPAPLAEAPNLCAACHRPHNGAGPKMWALTPLEGSDPISSICQSCHRKQGIAHSKTVGAISHPVDRPLELLGIEVTLQGWLSPLGKLFERQAPTPLPLFDAEGGRVAGAGRITCATCHDPHRHGPDGGHQDQGKFLRLANDREATLCRNCHRDKGSVALSKHNLARSAPEETNIQGTPAREGNPCSNCHLPHNGAGAKLWAGITASGGADRVSELCLGCHQEGGVAEAKQTGAHSHPLRVDIKAVGLDTELPLFRSSGERDPGDGRLSCPTCHDPHQWDPRDPHSKQGADPAVEGNAANSFLRLSAQKAELCIDCHEDKAWVLGTDHDLNITAPEAANAHGQAVAESGTCGQCHQVHNAADAARLWARQPGAGQDTMERLCRSCHATGQAAGNKQPRKANHPADVTVISRQGWPRPGEHRGGFFPVYDQEGRVVNAGAISCPTCHNPHQWRPDKALAGPGVNEEGSVRSSFLRNKSSYSICTNCHGLDALFRYKYFHGESSRQPHDLYR